MTAYLLPLIPCPAGCLLRLPGPDDHLQLSPSSHETQSEMLPALQCIMGVQLAELPFLVPEFEGLWPYVRH